MTKTALGPLMVDVEGLTLSPEDRQLLQQPLVGGVIIFKRNYQSRQQLVTLIEQIRECQPGVLIAVDQEGGRVQRLQDDGFTRIPPMQKLGDQYQQEPDNALVWAKQLGWLMASEVLCLGIDFSFAPVLDVDFDLSSIIGDRSFSKQTEVVVAVAAEFMAGMHEAGMATTGKHYPGHGAVVEDSHLTLPVDSRAWAEIEARDLKPFVELQGQLDAVMPAHIIFDQVDPSPVGFSKLWLQTILRQQQSFDGVIFSDDLSMEGAVVAGGYVDRAKVALAAGCDMVLVCNNRRGAIEVLDYLIKVDYSNGESQQRLAQMAAKARPQWHNLQQSQRWVDAKNVAEQLSLIV